MSDIYPINPSLNIYKHLVCPGYISYTVEDASNITWLDF
jgi:hypothetical protein